MIFIRRHVWSALESHSPQDLSQSESSKSKKDTIEGGLFSKSAGLSSDLTKLSLNFLRSVSPSIASGVVYTQRSCSAKHTCLLSS